MALGMCPAPVGRDDWIVHFVENRFLQSAGFRNFPLSQKLAVVCETDRRARIDARTG